jgi:hypothetical protein
VGRLVRRVRDWTPFTALGLCVGLAAAVGLRVFAFARLDLVWLVVAYALLGLLAFDLLLVVVATVVLKVRLRAPEGQVLVTQTETPTLTGFVLPRWTFVPLIRVQHELVAPVHAALVESPWAGRPRELQDEGPLRDAEWVRFARRGEASVIERRVVVSDVLGLSQLAFRLRQELSLAVRPHPGALERMPVLTSLAAGDEQAHPLGAADGDRIELRRYQPGDPARFIHWKIYARTGKLLVRQPERSLTQTTRTVAYLIAGPRDEASAAAARVALEQGALGADWLFGADGTPTPASDLPAALEAIVRSGDTPTRTKRVTPTRACSSPSFRRPSCVARRASWCSPRPPPTGGCPRSGPCWSSPPPALAGCTWSSAWTECPATRPASAGCPLVAHPSPSTE